MTINGSTNSNGWTYKMEVVETSTNVTNRTSTIQVKTYLGRSNSTSWIAGDWNGTITVAGTPRNVSGNLPYQTWINSGDWKELKTETFVVSNTGSPTTISISSTWNSSGTSPSYASASGSMQLTILHVNPSLTNVEFTEQNTTLSNLGVGDNYFVPYLSIKKLKITGTAYDDATINLYEAINRTKIYSSQTNEIIMNLQQNELYTTYVDFLHRDVAELSIRLTDDKNGKSTTAYPYSYVIPYKKPTIERASTSIKRKSGQYSETLQRVANLTDSIVSLNLKANIYKGNDVVGNNNSITQIAYKIWDTDDSEPSAYTSITQLPTPDQDGNITISDFEISNISYINVYNYKIIISDNFGYIDEIIDGKVSTGVSVWSEYSDHVNFIKLTVDDDNPFEYSTNETKCGIWYDGTSEKTKYRKVLNIGSLPSNATKTIAHNISSLDMIVDLKGIAIRSSDKDTLPIPYVTFNANNSGGILVNANATNVNVTTTTDRSAYNGYIVIEYTKS